MAVKIHNRSHCVWFRRVGLAGALLSLGLGLSAVEGRRVGIRDGWFTLDGNPLFIKGVCYFENHVVDGRHERSSLAVIDEEFRRIRLAGFNAIRSQLNEEELALAHKHGLFVLQHANHLFFSREYEDSETFRREKEITRSIVSDSRTHENILGYLIDNEPQGQGGKFHRGEESLVRFHRALMSEVRSADPGAVVSMATFPPMEFLDYAPYPAVFLNLYPFCPSCGSLGYDGYVDWFKRKHALGKPLVISEYGWQAERGEKDFSRTILKTLDDQIAGGATGSFFYTWRAYGPEGRGDNLWMGLIPTDGRAEDHRNPARTILADLSTYFEAVVIDPRSGSAFPDGDVPLRVYGTDRTVRMEAVVNGKSIRLAKKGRYWWRGTVRPKERSGWVEIKIVSFDAGGRRLASKDRRVWIGARPEWHVRIERSNERLSAGGVYQAAVKVTDAQGNPASKVVLALSFTSSHSPWFPNRWKAETDDKGVYLVHRPAGPEGMLTFAAGINDPNFFCVGTLDTVRVGP